MDHNTNIQGRVLRVKSGYNPNSSSIGSDIPTFLAAASVAGTAAMIIINILATARERILSEHKAVQDNDDTGDSDE